MNEVSIQHKKHEKMTVYKKVMVMQIQWIGSLHQLAKVLKLQLQLHQSLNEYLVLIPFRIDWFDLLGPLIWRADSLEKTLMLGIIEGKRRRWQRMRWLDGITDSMAMNLGGLWETVEDRESWPVAIYGVIKSWLWLSDLTKTMQIQGIS